MSINISKLKNSVNVDLWLQSSLTPNEEKNINIGKQNEFNKNEKNDNELKKSKLLKN
jgi:hypothetical protein